MTVMIPTILTTTIPMNKNRTEAQRGSLEETMIQIMIQNHNTKKTKKKFIKGTSGASGKNKCKWR